MISQEPIRFWMSMAFLHGLLVGAGVLMVVWHLLALKPGLTESQPASRTEERIAVQPA